MNAPTLQAALIGNGQALLSPQAVRHARAIAQRDQRPVPEVLEAELGLDADALMRLLGQALGHEVLDIHALNRLEPAFDLLSYADALGRGCIVFRDASQDAPRVLGVRAEIGRASCRERV